MLALLGAGSSSCLKAPDFPVEPSVDFNNVRLVRRPLPTPNSIEVDDVFITLDFRDGDGDLGLDPDDIKVPPFNTSTGGPNNLGYGYNYYAKPFKKVNGVFRPLAANGAYDGRYPRLEGSVDGKSAPLKGNMTFKLPAIILDGVTFDTGDVVRFEVSILDRKLHQSNVVTTSEFVLGR